MELLSIGFFILIISTLIDLALRECSSVGVALQANKAVICKINVAHAVIEKRLNTYLSK